MCRALLNAGLTVGLWLIGADIGPKAVAQAPSCRLVEDGFGPAGSVAIRAEPLVTGLEIPWGVAFLPGGELLVTERPGRVRLIRGGVLVPEPVLTIEVSARGEAGLLGIAAHPDFSENRLFFVYYTHAGGETNRIERYRLNGDGSRAVLDGVILEGIPAATLHDGGRLRFGPDGMLYASTGDTREAALSQNAASAAGKILRVDPEGGIPVDNPIAGNPAFLLGIRNSQGFDWLDPNTLVVTDHGPSGEMGRFGHDELTFARAGDNLGWPTAWRCEAKPGLVAPALVWEDALPPGGAALYRGSAIPEWQGSVLVGSLGARHLQRVAVDPAGPSVNANEVYLRGDPPEGLGRIRDVTTGPDGELYVTTSNCDGRGQCGPEKDGIFKILPAPTPPG